MFNNKIIPIFLWVLILQGCKNVEVIVEGNGRVYDVVGEENINCGSGASESKCKNSYGTGVDSVTFKAEPDLGYRLKDWGNSCKGDVCSSTFLEGIPELIKVAFEKVPTEISYTYNAGGQRVSKTVGGVTTFFIYQLDGSLLAELDANGNTLVDYIYLEGKPIAQVRPQSSGTDDTAYIHADHIGAPKAATNQSGKVIWQIKTTPFGEVYSEIGTLAQNQRFPGQYADNESNYSYNYFRDYDPSIGRYIQSDPIGLSGGLNTYGYVGGNPVMRIDPLGLRMLCSLNRYDDFSTLNCVDFNDGKSVRYEMREPANNGNAEAPYGPNGLLPPGQFDLKPRTQDGNLFNQGDPQFTTPGRTTSLVISPEGENRWGIGPHVGNNSLGCPLFPATRDGRKDKNDFYDRFSNSPNSTSIYVNDYR